MATLHDTAIVFAKKGLRSLCQLRHSNSTSHLRGMSTRVIVANNVHVAKCNENLSQTSKPIYNRPFSQTQCYSSSTVIFDTNRSESKPNDQTIAKGEDKGIFAKIWDRYSFQGQQKRIILGERLFRSAQYRANDP